MASFEFVDYGNASNAAFMGDFGNREHIMPGGTKLDAASFVAEGEVLVKLSAAALAAATTLAVDAVSGAIPDNTLLDFGGQQARVNGAVTAGATSITVDALAAGIADNAEAVYDPETDADVVPAGTLVGRTNAEKLAGAAFGAAADADDEVFITVADVNTSRTTDVDLVRHGSLIKFDLLPSWAGASSTLRTKLHSFYQIVKS